MGVLLPQLGPLITRRTVSREAERALLEEVARGVYRVESFDADDIGRMEKVIARYGRLQISLADASLVVLASRYGIRDLLTLDERHFRAMRGPGGRPFRLLPADA